MMAWLKKVVAATAPPPDDRNQACGGTPTAAHRRHRLPHQATLGSVARARRAKKETAGAPWLAPLDVIKAFATGKVSHSKLWANITCAAAALVCGGGRCAV